MSEPLPQPDRIGKYRINRLLGRGGMGVVYSAEDPLLHRAVAIKLLTRDSTDQPETRERFLREARAIASLNHPNIVTVHEIDQHQDDWFLVMELVPGGSLQDHLTTHGPFTWPQATRLLADVCRALAAAHAAGILHRDLKPANLLLAAAATVKVADFGLAKILDPTVPSLTGLGTILGTPDFMSPEQCQGNPATEQSDLYSLGATYFALLTGGPPFRCETAVQTLLAHCMKPLPDPRTFRPDIPEPCTVILAKALAKNPADRYPSCQALLDDLSALLDCPVTVPLRPVLAGVPVTPPIAAADTQVLKSLPLRTSTRWRIGVLVTSVLVLVTSLVIWMLNGNGPITSPPLPDQERLFHRDHLPKDGFRLATDNSAYSLAFSPDAKYLAAGIYTGTYGVLLWDLEAGTVQKLWPKLGVRAIAFSSDGLFLAAGGGSDGKVRLLNLTTNQTQVKFLHEHLTAINGLAFVDARTLVVAGSTGNLAPSRLWKWDIDARQHNYLPEGKGVHQANPLALVISKEGNLLILSDSDGFVHIWDLTNEGRVTSFQTAPKKMDSLPLALAPNSRLLALGFGKRVQLRDPKKPAQPLKDWDARQEVWSLAFSEDSSILLTAGGILRFWDTSAQNILPDLRFKETLFRVALGPGGKLLATSRGGVYLQDARPLFAREKP